MALPLLLAGAGLLGGGIQFLSNKTDARNAESQLGSLSQFSNTNLRPAQQQFIQYGAQNALSSRGFGKADAMGALQQQALQMGMQNEADAIAEGNTERRYQQSQSLAHDRFQFDQNNEIYKRGQDDLEYKFKLMDELRKQQTAGIANNAEIRAAANEIQGDITGMEQAFNDRTSQIRQTYNMMGDGNMSGTQLYASTLGLLQSLLPGEAIMEGDISAAIKAGGKAQQLASLMNQWTGRKIDGDQFKKEVVPILGALQEENVRKWEPVRNRAIERMKAYNVNPMDVFLQDQSNPWRMPAVGTVSQPVGPGGQQLQMGEPTQFGRSANVRQR